MFSAIGQHAIGELIEMTSTVQYNPVSKPTGNFNALNFRERDDYEQPPPGTNIAWDDNTTILWDDNTEILWDE